MLHERGNPMRRVFENKYKKLIIAFLLIVLLFVLGQILVGNFIQADQILFTVKLASFIALFGLCQMVVIIGGNSALDLSVGYAATTSVVFTASIMDGKDENLWLAILVAVGIGFMIGLLNGTLSAYLKLPAFVVTLATANILQGVVNLYSAGRSITGKPSPILTEIAAKSTGSFPNIIILLIIVAVAVTIILKKTRLGLMLFGVGANEKSAYLSGANVKMIRLISFIVSGVVACLIGLLLVGNMGIAMKDMGSSYVMPSIAAVVVGGVSLAGGEGDFLGVILGAIFLQTLTNLLVALGWGDAGKWTGFGIVLFVLLIVYVSNRRRR
jgi:ribose transport system permease protein